MSYTTIIPLLTFMGVWLLTSVLWLRAIHLQLLRMTERIDRLAELTGQGLRATSDTRQSVEMLTVRVDVLAHRLEATRPTGSIRVSA